MRLQYPSKETLSREGWDSFFLKMAQLVATKSKDKSTKVGAVIVGPDNEVRSIGYNGFCRGVDETPEREERPAKYLWTEHAERNALYNALRSNIPVKGCILYLNVGPCPCHDCTRACIQSGITEIVVPKDADFPGKGEQWAESLRVAKEMLFEACVKVRVSYV